MSHSVMVISGCSSESSTLEIKTFENIRRLSSWQHYNADSYSQLGHEMYKASYTENMSAKIMYTYYMVQYKLQVHTNLLAGCKKKNVK